MRFIEINSWEKSIKLKDDGLEAKSGTQAKEITMQMKPEWKNLGLLLLSLLLGTAGVVHIADPQVFLPAIPPTVPYRIEIVILTGILEIAFIPFFFTKYRRTSLALVKWYFLLLLPVHMYVSLYGIPMFGTNHPVILWGRTFLQLPLVYWVHRLEKAA